LASGRRMSGRIASALFKSVVISLRYIDNGARGISRISSARENRRSSANVRDETRISLTATLHTRNRSRASSRPFGGEIYGSELSSSRSSRILAGLDNIRINSSRRSYEGSAVARFTSRLHYFARGRCMNRSKSNAQCRMSDGDSQITS
jgi:hypothetical protein